MTMTLQSRSFLEKDKVTIFLKMAKLQLYVTNIIIDLKLHSYS